MNNIIIGRAKRGYMLHLYKGGEPWIEYAATYCRCPINTRSEIIATLPDPDVIKKIEDRHFGLCSNSRRCLPNLIAKVKLHIAMETTAKEVREQKGLIHEMEEIETGIQNSTEILKNLEELQKFYQTQSAYPYYYQNTKPA